MPGSLDSLLWAVHISDGVLAPAWWLGGLLIAAMLLIVAASGLKDEEIPQVALLSAAFFVASLIHVRVGPTSVHLLLNGLVGVVLGRRAGLAIFVGLALQVTLLGHGGFTTLGINSCILTLPALLAWGMFCGLHRVSYLGRPWFRALLVAVPAFVWTLSLVYSVVLLGTNRFTELETLNLAPANAVAIYPVTLSAALLLAVCSAWLEHRLENAPEFPLGLLVGGMAVLATTLLNCLILLWGGQEDWHTLALLVFVAHLPIAVIEGIVLGFAVGFLAKVKPEMLGGEKPHFSQEFSKNGAVPSANGNIQRPAEESPLHSTENAQ
jgi:cobalt/nickel transport system permease protein